MMPRSILGAVVEQAPAALPLRVTGAEWAAESLTIWGDGWSFSTLSSWRLSSGGSFVSSSLHHPEDAGQRLLGQTLQAVAARPGATINDITLLFSGGIVLEVFSDMEVEPWILSLPGRTYVPSYVHD